jgi:DNA invertase Pin-like site-specific DNA recombinase
MRVAIYARVSTTDQNCELQLSDLLKMAESRGFELVGEYVDKGISGAKDNRPELNRLMKDARRGRFKAVLVWRFDRFARSLKHLVTALEEFRSLGVEFLSHQEAVDTSTPAGRMLFQVIGAMAEFEREIIRERVIGGLRRAKENGTRLGRPKVEVDIDTARRLKEQGLSYKAVAEQLGVSVGSLHGALNGSKHPRA